MKKLILVFSGMTLLFLMGISVFVPLKLYAQGIPKKKLTSEQLEIIKQKIKESQDVIRLDPESKGSFSWWGHLEYPGDWDFYYLICGEGNLEIHLTDIPEFSDYDLYLFDCNGVVLDSSINSFNDPEEIIRWVTTDTYWIGVYCWSGGDAGDPYHLYGTYVTPPKLPDLKLQSLTATNYNPSKNSQKMLDKSEPPAKLVAEEGSKPIRLLTREVKRKSIGMSV
jgi:hypothetical protein